MKKKYNTIELCFEKHADKYDETGWTGALEALAKLLDVLIKNEQMIKIWSDECAIVVEYNYQDPEFCGVSLEWLDESDDLSDSDEGETD